MSAIWSDAARFSRWLEVELAVCRAWTEMGKIPPEAMREIEEKASFSVERIQEIEQVTQHDVIAFVSCVAERVGDAGKYIHLGLTSSDVIDTAASLQLVGAFDVLISELDLLLDAIYQRAVEYRDVPCVGRTHGIHAEPMTFGLKMLNGYAQLLRDRTRLKEAQDQMRVGKISGAVGTYANCPPEIEKRVCEILGLSIDPVSTQIIQRDRHAVVLSALAVYGGTLERIALEIRHLQRTEVREVLEPFGKGQKGSSAMPHKKNPILSERVCGMSRLLRGYLVSALENIALWHERDISHSSVERVIWPDAFQIAHTMTRTLLRVIRGLVVDPERMRKNLEATRGLLFSGRVLLALVEEGGLSREESYAIVQENAMKCWEGAGDFFSLLASDSRVTSVLPQDRLKSLFDENHYLRYIHEIFNRFPSPQRQTELQKEA